MQIKKFKTPVMITAGVFLFVLILFLGLRNFFLTKAIQKVQVKLKKQYGFELVMDKALFTGVNKIIISKCSIVPSTGDTLFATDEVNFTLRFFKLLAGEIRLNRLQMNNTFIHLLKKGDYKNYVALADTTTKRENSDENFKTDNYAKTTFNLIKKMLDFIPEELILKNYSVRITDDEHVSNIVFKDLFLKEKILNTTAEITENNEIKVWHINGFADIKKRKFDINLSSMDNSTVNIPYLGKKLNLLLGFQSIKLSINEIDFDDDILIINGLAKINKAVVNHSKIASKDVIFNQVEFNYHFLAGSNFFELDSSSIITLNGYNVYPFVKIQNNQNAFTYWFNLKTEKRAAQDFLDALPDGLFENIKGMEATGDFSYKLNFMLDEENPDEMIFDSELKKENLKIIRYGKANISKMNQDFIHYPVENGKPVRPIYVSSENPDFYKLEDISSFLKNAVLTNEDPSFFYHRGFVTDAFRQSIVKNIKTGQFKRGASTISMQLMKNVFLTREKTIARKLEEILLVYILENNYLVSKERMFEIYLNIIEWGPNIYGIGEASRFYFNKKPSQLTLSESLYLASIIPSPKKFMWRFDHNGIARNWLEKSFRFIANKMITRQFINPDDTVNLTHMVNITGQARKYIIRNDSLFLTDSILINQLENERDD